MSENQSIFSKTLHNNKAFVTVKTGMDGNGQGHGRFVKKGIKAVSLCARILLQNIEIVIVTLKKYSN
jgi:hypothetical protein